MPRPELKIRSIMLGRSSGHLCRDLRLHDDPEQSPVGGFESLAEKQRADQLSGVHTSHNSRRECKRGDHRHHYLWRQGFAERPQG